MLFKSQTLIFVIAAALAICSVVQCEYEDEDAVYDGVILQNAYVHVINTSLPLDSNIISIQVSGTWNKGEILFNVSGPQTFCPDGPSSCGKNVQDLTVIVKSRKGLLTLKSMTNNPSPFAFGNASQYEVTGTWSQDGNLDMTSSYFINLLRGTVASLVPIRAKYVGEIDVPNFQLEQFGWVVPYVNVLYGGVHPYQFLATYGVMNSSSNELNHLAGFRALSPYGTPTAPGYPPSPYAVSGTVTDVSIVKGVLRGVISVHTPAYELNVTNAPFKSDYEWINKDAGYLRINLGLARDPVTGVEIFLDNHQLLVKERDD